MNSIPRAEHPRPDRKRSDWLNLNGEWGFEIDYGRSGIEREFFKRRSLNDKITVPFCPESRLSGIENTDFLNAVWYKRDIEIPQKWTGKRILLHIDASNYKTVVFVNGNKVGSHTGGYTSFEFDITDQLCKSDNYLSVYAESDVRNSIQFSGKQSKSFYSKGCSYTRTTGIWQTVWLEAVEPSYVKSYRVYPNVTECSVGLDISYSQSSIFGKLTVSASYKGREMGRTTASIVGNNTFVTLPLAEKHLWEVGNGALYDLHFELEKDGKTDIMDGYFGLREIALSKQNGLQINGKTVFGRFVLDQGFNPDGIITAQNDEALIFDIQASMACGFNGARLHQKVFEPRFLYHADRLGYMVWAETANWGFDHTKPQYLPYVLPEWLEEVDRDFSHPSVIGWCPFNETWDINGTRQCNAMLDAFYDITKRIDTTRPTITCSGSFPTERTDAHDVHDYEQDPEKLRSYYSHIEEGIVNDQLLRSYGKRQCSKTWLPIFVSEYGGIKWVENDDGNSWGYGQSVKSEDDFFARLEGLTDALLENKNIFAFCYTQLTDVEQEKNGLLTYRREFKFSPDKYYRIFVKKAAIES